MQIPAIPHTAEAIHVGRRVRIALPYHRDVDGVIFAVHGEPTGQGARPGAMQIIRAGAMQFDVITLEGMKREGIHETSIGRLGIGCVTLLDKVHGPGMIEALHRAVAKKIVDDRLAAEAKAHAFQKEQAAIAIEQEPVFFWNGIKDAKGAKLQRCHYSLWGAGSATGKYPAGTIAIYARDYKHFSALLNACFTVTNDSDSMTDYFANDTIHVIPTHPLYAKVLAAHDAMEAHNAKRYGRSVA